MNNSTNKQPTKLAVCLSAIVVNTFFILWLWIAFYFDIVFMQIISYILMFLESYGNILMVRKEFYDRMVTKNLVPVFLQESYTIATLVILIWLRAPQLVIYCYAAAFCVGVYGARVKFVKAQRPGQKHGGKNGRKIKETNE